MKRTFLVSILMFFFFAGLASAALIDNVRGRILLQVEEGGEAWYVNPTNDKRYYMKDGEAAYQIMSLFGLGITNSNLSKIPIGLEDRFEEIDSDNDGLSDKLEEALGTDLNNPDTDGDSYTDGTEVQNGFNPLGEDRVTIDVNLADSLKGRILLQVESRGEAWYINPVDGRRYYMQGGEAAYQIMRYLGLGITNENLNQLVSGEPIMELLKLGVTREGLKLRLEEGERKICRYDTNRDITEKEPHFLEAGCNELSISFKYGYVSDQTKEEIEELIHDNNGTILFKHDDFGILTAVFELEEKMYEIKDIINQKEYIGASFNWIIELGLD